MSANGCSAVSPMTKIASANQCARRELAVVKIIPRHLNASRPMKRKPIAKVAAPPRLAIRRGAQEAVRQIKFLASRSTY